MNSCSWPIIFFSSFDAPLAGEQDGHAVWGRLKSPAKIIVGRGEGKVFKFAEISARHSLNWSEVEILPFRLSFGDQYQVQLRHSKTQTLNDTT